MLTKWYNAPIGLGQAWVDTTTVRSAQLGPGGWVDINPTSRNRVLGMRFEGSDFGSDNGPYMTVYYRNGGVEYYTQLVSGWAFHIGAIVIDLPIGTEVRTSISARNLHIKEMR